jgi:hypothetical protein
MRSGSNSEPGATGTATVTVATCRPVGAYSPASISVSARRAAVPMDRLVRLGSGLGMPPVNRMVPPPGPGHDRCEVPSGVEGSEDADDVGIEVALQVELTISRELRRNAATRGGKPAYRATVAQWKAQTAARARSRPGSSRTHA